MFNLTTLFDMTTARSKAFADYSVGEVAFVSNGFYNNGILGYVEPFDDDKVFERPAICVSAFCEATVQRSPFIARGNGGSGLTILTPKQEMDYDQLLRIASHINVSLKWKYSYGRMVNQNRLQHERLPELPDNCVVVAPQLQGLRTDDAMIATRASAHTMSSFTLAKLFTLKQGDFHSLNDLDDGNYPTVSRIEYNNGIVGFYDKPSDALIYPPLTITVSTVTGDSFVQLSPYIATDNVVILTPKKHYAPPTMFFIALMVNREKWRWRYGRQCYKTKLSSLSIQLPINSDGEIDETFIEKVVIPRWGWGFIDSYLRSQQ